MVEIKGVRGGAAQAQPLIIGKDIVYIHSNITLIDEEKGIYEYDEIQMPKDNYIKLMAEKNADLEQQLTNAQLALVELYERMIL